MSDLVTAKESKKRGREEHELHLQKNERKRKLKIVVVCQIVRKIEQI